MTRRRLTLLIAGLALIAIGLFIVFQWNKPHRKAEAENGIAISTAALIAAYGKDEKAADAQYLNKTVAVTGRVAKVEKNQDGQTTVLFDSADPTSSVFCTLRDKGATVPAGQVATLKGFCSGHTMDVLITDCIIVK